MRAQSDPSPPARDPRERAWIAPGVLAAGALVLLRTRVLEALALGRGVEPEAAGWAAAGRLGPTAVHALALGLCAAAVAWYGGARGRAQALAGSGLAALFLASALTGWPVAPPVDLALAGGAGFANAGLLGALAVAGALLLAAARPAIRRFGLASVLARPVALGAIGLVAVGLPLGLVFAASQRAPSMRLREVVRELVDPKAWRVLEEDAEHPPAAGVISPLVDFHFDSADKPALVMPPPCLVERVIAEDEDGAHLFAAAGADVSVRGLLSERERALREAPEGGLALRVRFAVLLDGEPVFDRVVELRSEDYLRRTGRLAECEWIHAGGADGIALKAGQRLTLRTSLPDLEGAAPEASRGLAVGFGGLTLERRVTRPRTRATPDRPNVLLVVMDTLRSDRMSCYGYAKPTTPRVDSLAERGILFEHAFATASWTWPSTASILTGLLPDEHGVTSNASCTLHLSVDTLAEALQARGFSTAAVACNPLIASERYFDQGFESFDDAPRMRKSDEVIDSVVQTIERLADRRFFLYLHFVDPHTPHRPLASELARLGGERPDDFPDVERDGELYDGLDNYATRLLKGEPPTIVPPSHARWIDDSYDASVATGDHYVGVVLDALERLGLSDTTVVAFTADHGEELLDHGLLAHGHTVHRELVEVPLVLAGPGLPHGARVATEVSNRHLATTLARLGGAELPRVSDGLNLLASPLPERPIFYATEKGVWDGRKQLALYGLRDEGYVLHRAHAGAGEPELEHPERLYRIEDDPLERVDLTLDPALAERAQALGARVEAMLAAQRQRRTSAGTGAGSGAIDTLRGVGYLDSDRVEVSTDEQEER